MQANTLRDRLSDFLKDNESSFSRTVAIAGLAASLFTGLTGLIHWLAGAGH
jgi:hypothetical protein